jgi:hypothetical protein
VDEAESEPADEFAACDASPAEPPEEEALPTEEISGTYDELEAVPVAPCNEPAAAEPGSDECINPWDVFKKSKKDKKDKKKKRDPIWDEEVAVEEAPAPPEPKSKKDKKKKRDPIRDEEAPVEEAPAEEPMYGWEKLECN